MNIKSKIKRQIVSKLVDKNYIISSTIVGSFNESKGLDGISDIDIVIIVDDLTELRFKEIISSFESFNVEEVGLKDFEIFINSTFGPLKFNSRKKIVFHLMIYDVKGHILHVEESPFTCHSWENNLPILGIPLKKVYPVLNLQLSDILDSRRGIISYIDDLRKGSITFRRYEFIDNKPIIKRDNFGLDMHHKVEYSYHITYHLLNNFYKIITRDKKSLDYKKLFEFFEINKFFSKEDILLYYKLSLWKNEGERFPDEVLSKTKNFASNFFLNIKKIQRLSTTLKFVRHERTELNDGTFLGIGRDPGIEKRNITKSLIIFDDGFHSRLKRSKETMNYFSCKNIFESNLIDEINYGYAEGLSFDKFSSDYPEIISEWISGKDPSFPGGESQSDVFKRVIVFLKRINLSRNTIVVTHLVVLRMILNNYLDLELKELYKIKIEHLDGFHSENILSEYSPITFDSHVRQNIRTQLSINND